MSIAPEQPIDNRPSSRIRSCINAYASVRSKGGTAPLVSLSIGYQHFHEDFIEKCLDELDRIPIRVEVGDTPSNLEKLAYELLAVGVFAKADY